MKTGKKSASKVFFGNIQNIIVDKYDAKNRLIVHVL